MSPKDGLIPDCARWLVHSVLGALDAARRINGIGLTLGGLTLLVMALRPMGQAGFACGAVAVAVGLLELGLLVRIAIDQRLFAALVLTCTPEHLVTLDQALAALGWRSPVSHSRPLVERARGAVRFLPWAVALTVLQLPALLFLLST